VSQPDPSNEPTLDALIAAIDQLVEFVTTSGGDQPQSLFTQLLERDHEVESLCQATGVTLPTITYEGTYGGDLIGYCKMPVSRYGSGIKVWGDRGWLAAMNGLRKTAILLRAKKRQAAEADEQKTDDPVQMLRAQQRQIEQQKANKVLQEKRKDQLDNCFENLRTFDRSRLRQALNREPTDEECTTRLEELISLLGQELNEQGLIQVLDAIPTYSNAEAFGLDLAKLGASGQRGEVLRRLQGIMDCPDVHPYVTLFLQIYLGERFRKLTAPITEAELSGNVPRDMATIWGDVIANCNELEGLLVLHSQNHLNYLTEISDLWDQAWWSRGGDSNIPVPPEKPRLTEDRDNVLRALARMKQWATDQLYKEANKLVNLPRIPIASDVPDLGKADTVPEFWEWCGRQRRALTQLRAMLGEPEPSSVATAQLG